MNKDAYGQLAGVLVLPCAIFFGAPSMSGAKYIILAPFGCKLILTGRREMVEGQIEGEGALQHAGALLQVSRYWKCARTL